MHASTTSTVRAIAARLRHARPFRLASASVRRVRDVLNPQLTAEQAAAVDEQMRQMNWRGDVL